jgi:hypothetical protein
MEISVTAFGMEDGSCREILVSAEWLCSMELVGWLFVLYKT